MNIKGKYKDFTSELEVLIDLLNQHPNYLCGFRDRVHDVKSTTKTYRVINSWESSGLLDDTREQEGLGWRKFSTSDIAWIMIISKLREFGLSIEKIKKTKESLLSPIESQVKKSNFGLSVIEWICLRILWLEDAGNTYLLVENDGTASVMTPQNFNSNNYIGTIPTAYVYININKLLTEAFMGGVPVWNDRQYILTKEESVLFNSIRVERPVSITSKLNKDGNIA